MKKKILITGGAGLIGKFIIKELTKTNKYKIFILDLPKQVQRNISYLKKFKNLIIHRGSINNLNLCNRITKNKDCVIHLAAMLGVQNTEINQSKCIQINYEGTENIINFSKKNNVKRFIFASSSEVYGEPKKNPITEKSDLNGKSIYAITKIVNEESIKKNKLKNYTILRFFNTIGEGQVGQFVVSKFIKRVKEKKNIIINGNGTQIRGYAHAEDIAKAIKKIIFLKKTYLKTYNLGNSNNFCTLNELAKKIKRLSNEKKVKIIYEKKFIKTDRNKKREIFRRYCSTNKAKKDFNFKCFIDLDESLKRIYNQKQIYDFWPK